MKDTLVWGLSLPAIKMIASTMPENSKDNLILAMFTAPRNEPFEVHEVMNTEKKKTFWRCLSSGLSAYTSLIVIARLLWQCEKCTECEKFQILLTIYLSFHPRIREHDKNTYLHI